MDEFGEGLKVKDAAIIDKMMSEGGLFLGTDPSEFLNKQDMVEAMKQMYTNEGLDFNFTLNKRETRIYDNGNAAIVIEQSIIPFISSHMPVRTVYYLIKAIDTWEIDFYSAAMILVNEDLPKINVIY